MGFLALHPTLRDWSWTIPPDEWDRGRKALLDIVARVAHSLEDMVGGRDESPEAKAFVAQLAAMPSGDEFGLMVRDTDVTFTIMRAEGSTDDYVLTNVEPPFSEAQITEITDP